MYTISGIAKYIIIDDAGYLKNLPVTTNLKMNLASNFFKFPNGDIGWTYVEAYGEQIFINRLSLPKK